MSPPAPAAEDAPGTLALGNFSVSLSVQDLAASRSFYEALGFEAVHGGPDFGYVVLRNGSSTIGLFHQMFEGNILTFNPGWDAAGEPLAEFTDVRTIQRQLESAGLSLTSRADEATSGPASLTLTDPDGNVILIDQHVDAPGTPGS